MYEETIKSTGGIDVQILGLGTNGHIGFNEPSSSLSSRTRVKTLTLKTIESNRSLFKNEEDMPRFCITMGIGTIMEAKTILLLAFGNNKSEAIAKCIEGPVTASVPASILQLHPDVKMIIDEEAASSLSQKDYYKWVYSNKNRVNDYLK
jgi:glucosamine-6-phosphate deaminase